VRDIMADNVELLLQNTDRLESIQESAEELAQAAGLFRDHSRKLRAKMCWRTVRFYALAVIALLCVLAIVISIAVVYHQ
jgi:hypothetical protein